MVKISLPASSVIIIAIIFSCSTGCGSGSDLTEASGIVSYQGRPVPSGNITFYPKHGRPASGNIESDGTFVLSSYRSGDGLPIGKYKVCVTAYKATKTLVNYDEVVRHRPAEYLVPKKYSSVSSSPLEIEVTKGGDNHFVIDIPTG